MPEPDAVGAVESSGKCVTDQSHASSSWHARCDPFWVSIRPSPAGAFKSRSVPPRLTDVRSRMPSVIMARHIISSLLSHTLQWQWIGQRCNCCQPDRNGGQYTATDHPVCLLIAGQKKGTGTMPVPDDCHAYYGVNLPGKVQFVNSVVVVSPVIRAAVPYHAIPD